MTTQEAIYYVQGKSPDELEQISRDGEELHLMLICEEDLHLLKTKTREAIETCWETVRFRDIVITGNREADIKRLVGDDLGVLEFIMPRRAMSAQDYSRRYIQPFVMYAHAGASKILART